MGGYIGVKYSKGGPPNNGPQTQCSMGGNSLLSLGDHWGGYSRESFSQAGQKIEPGIFSAEGDNRRKGCSKRKPSGGNKNPIGV